ncbi:MAG: 3-oxoacyl-[acyl-carrier-protein] reductase [Rickettsiales bacterium]|jgi:3-oxoacyl-[acyl-carrier protein] reductase|nr:3-oxoacyl-[acyl-carrier-protein] reductase [Rickettsiales bacterium]
MFDLTGKIALINGATGGIGEAVSKTLYNQGATTILAGRRIDALESLAKSLGERAHALAFDLSSTESIKQLVAKTVEIGGRLDILVNNAGMTRDALFMRMKDEDWQAVIDVNVTAPFKLAREAIMPMMKNRFGRVINISSIVGWTGNPGQANYTASKGALTSMTKTLAAEVASRGITANCVAPGFIVTAMTDGLPQEVKDHMLEQIPLKRFGSVDDVAAAVAFSASDEAAYITGQTIHVNGGMLRV